MRFLAFFALACGLALSTAAASACTAQETRSALVSFATAFNRGDEPALDALFAQPPDFRWYSSGGPASRRGAPARDRDGLLAYFEGRHANGDRLELASFRLNGNWGGHGNFQFVARRAVPRFRGGDWFRTAGKGAATCAAGSVSFAVMTFGTPLPPRPG